MLAYLILSYSQFLADLYKFVYSINIAKIEKSWNMIDKTIYIPDLLQIQNVTIDYNDTGDTGSNGSSDQHYLRFGKISCIYRHTKWQSGW